MLDTLMNLVRQHTDQAVTNNPAIPNGQNDEAMQAISSGILGGLQQQAQGGGLGSLLGMVMGQGGSASSGSIQQSPVTQGVQQNVQQSLIERLGISPQVAMSIAAAVVPMILSKLMHKAQDPTDHSINQNDILTNATGKQGVDWMGMAGSAMADGKLDMNDLMQVAGGFMKGSNPSQPSKQEDSGIGGLLGGLFGGR